MVIRMMREGSEVCLVRLYLPPSGQWLTQRTPGGGPPAPLSSSIDPSLKASTKGLASHKSISKLTEYFYTEHTQQHATVLGPLSA